MCHCCQSDFFSLRCLWAHWNIINVFWCHLWIIYLVLAVKDIVQTIAVVSWPRSARQQFIFCCGCLNAQQWEANIHSSNHHVAHTLEHIHICGYISEDYWNTEIVTDSSCQEGASLFWASLQMLSDWNFHRLMFGIAPHSRRIWVGRAATEKPRFPHHHHHHHQVLCLVPVVGERRWASAEQRVGEGWVWWWRSPVRSAGTRLTMVRR